MPDGYYPVINDEAENGQDLTGYSNEATLLCVWNLGEESQGQVKQ